MTNISNFNGNRIPTHASDNKANKEKLRAYVGIALNKVSVELDKFSSELKEFGKRLDDFDIRANKLMQEIEAYEEELMKEVTQQPQKGQQISVTSNNVAIVSSTSSNDTAKVKLSYLQNLGSVVKTTTQEKDDIKIDFDYIRSFHEAVMSDFVQHFVNYGITQDDVDTINNILDNTFYALLTKLVNTSSNKYIQDNDSKHGYWLNTFA